MTPQEMISNIEWLGHDSFRIKGSKTLYFDPYQIGDAEPADLCRRPARDLVALEDDPAFVRLGETGDEIEHRRLAGPVRPDDAECLAGRAVQRDVLDGVQPAEALRDLRNPEKC